MPIEPLYRKFGAEIAAMRRQRGLTQEEAAKTAGMPRPLWSKVENGRFRVQLHSLPSIARALGVDPATLACWAMGTRRYLPPDVARAKGAV